MICHISGMVRGVYFCTSCVSSIKTIVLGDAIESKERIGMVYVQWFRVAEENEQGDKVSGVK